MRNRFCGILGEKRMDREDCKKKLNKKCIRLKKTFIMLALIFKPSLIILIHPHAMLKASTLHVPIRHWIPKVLFSFFFLPIPGNLCLTPYVCIESNSY